MGNCRSTQTNAKPHEDGSNHLAVSLHSNAMTNRQCLAWLREGVDITEVYDVLEIIGHGSMGEVTVVRKKPGRKRSLSKDMIENCLAAMENGKFSEKLDDQNGHISHNGCNGHSSHNGNSDHPENVIDSSHNGGRKYACKTVNAVRMKWDHLDEFINEINILRDLDHPNIAQLYEIYQNKRKLWIVTELCSGGDLYSRSSNMPEADVAVVMEQILRAVVYMHKRGICHRDLKLENIMYADMSPEAEVKLIDFGLSNKFIKGEKMLRVCGTVYTAAPELFGGQGCSEKSDVWSLGVICFVLLSEEYPFLKELSDMNDEAKKSKFFGAKFTFSSEWKIRQISKPAKEFVFNCLRRHPGARWTAQEALKFMQDVWIPHLEENAIAQLSTRVEEINGISTPTKPVEMKRSLVLRSKKKRTRMDSSTLEGISTFSTYGELKKTILMTMAYTMDKEGLDELKNLFIAIDVSNTGTITLADLKNAMKMHSDKNFDDLTVEKLFRGIDIDHSGDIHYVEYLAAVAESQGLLTLEKLADAFDRLDSDDKGYISRDDLKKFLGSDSDEELVNRMIEEAGAGENGHINYEEFLKLMFDDPAVGFEKMKASVDIGDKTMIKKLGLFKSNALHDPK